ncbi:GlxA family transcriptional regulator [Terricaulis silvestris]|uniref:GlxA family transcriptional regulator n=1 Tax=Terricaulis silvestris TaxID=2686094 RepID=UPI00131AB801|nr:GlxA family transcriptional regulator [Terricaulis silvestris]
MSKTPRFPPRPRTVLFVLFPGFQILDVAGPLSAFEIAAQFAPKAYRLKLAAAKAGMTPSSSGVAMQTEPLKGQSNIDTLVISGGGGTRDALSDATLIASLKRMAPRVRRVTSVCSGAFILAQAGLLDGKSATTHWRRAPQLASMFPNVSVDPDCIYVRDGDVWTSAGVSAGIDLALALIADDLGADVASNVAREMVVYAKRPGGQAQHSALLDLDAPRFAKLNAWMRDHLSDDLSVERLARKAAMSERNFARAYAAETGVTPAKAVERMRAEAARTALARGGGIQDISRKTGFGDPERMRRAFVRLYGAPPAAMRRTLRQA